MPVHPENSLFSASRLSAARLRRGMTMEGLAKAVGVERHAISRYEAGLFAPNAGHLRAMTQELHFPLSFFFVDDIGELPRRTASFRSVSKRTARQRDRALGSAAVAIVLNRTIERLYELPELALPVLPKNASPERAASLVRMKWDLDDKPIKSVVQLLESMGVRIFSLPADAAAIDTFSMWHQDRPYVLLNRRKVENQLRFDAARELGHLLLHRHAPATGRQAQERACNFASAFLMPTEIAKTNALPTDANDVMHVCARWGLPPAVAAGRLHKQGLLSVWNYRQHRITLEQEAPVDQVGGAVQRETPQLLQRVFYTLRAQGMTKRTLTRTFNVYLEDIDALTFGLVSAIFDASDVHADVGRLPPRLRVVSSA